MCRIAKSRSCNPSRAYLPGNGTAISADHLCACVSCVPGMGVAKSQCRDSDRFEDCSQRNKCIWSPRGRQLQQTVSCAEVGSPAEVAVTRPCMPSNKTRFSSVLTAEQSRSWCSPRLSDSLMCLSWAMNGIVPITIPAKQSRWNWRCS